jgi:hypothetical protein
VNIAHYSAIYAHLWYQFGLGLVEELLRARLSVQAFLAQFTATVLHRPRSRDQPHFLASEQLTIFGVFKIFFCLHYKL